MFRRPNNPLLLSLLIGSGAQILGVAVFIVGYSVYDYYFDKAKIVTMAAGALPWFGLFNGYVAARFYTFFNGSSWMQLACCASIFLPFLLSCCICVIDLCEWIETGRADSIPVREAAVLAYYWFFFHGPSVWLGAFFAFKKKPS